MGGREGGREGGWGKVRDKCKEKVREEAKEQETIKKRGSKGITERRKRNLQQWKPFQMVSILSASRDVSASINTKHETNRESRTELKKFVYLHTHKELHHFVAHFEIFDLLGRNIVFLHGDKLSGVLDALEDHVVVWLDVYS